MRKPLDWGKSRATFALEVIRQEAEALAAIADRANKEELGRALGMLLQCKGKVVLLGSGKSGIAARKIASTLTSTGTVAIFLHAADALHGDLGIVTTDDVVVAVSNTGQTDEVNAAVEHLKTRHVPVIAITGSSSSELGKCADSVLEIRVDREAGSLNVAPTSSTTAAMVLGDAIAMVLMDEKGFTIDDFARLHPGGLIGRRLRIRVADVMHAADENPTVIRGTPWSETLRAITEGRLGAVSVVGEDGTLVGLITDGDIRRFVTEPEGRNLAGLTANDVMTTDPTTTTPETLAYDALRSMEDRPSQISVLPVVAADHKSIGLVRVHDIVLAGLR